MRTTTGTKLVKKYFGLGSITTKRLHYAVQREMDVGWSACYVPATTTPDRSVVLLPGDHPFVPTFTLIRQRGRVVRPLSIVECQMSRVYGSHVKIDSLTARNCLSKLGLVIVDLHPLAITLTGTCPRLARIVNYPLYGLSTRGWLAKTLVTDALGLPVNPKRIHDSRRLEAGLLLNEHAIDASDICSGGEWVNLKPRWTVAEKLNGRKVA